MHAISLSNIQINSLSFTINSESSSQKTTEKIQGLESELFKSNLLLKKKDLEINNLQKIIAKQRETSNDTSNSFLLSSEFKKEWIDLGTTVIMESFEHVFNRSLLLSNMVQETFLITFTETKKLIHDKVNHIMKFFNITSDYEKFAMKVKPFFEEYFISIFFGNKTENESLVNTILTTLSNNIINKSICKYFHKEILQDIQSENIKNFINKSIRLCLYMHLHSPVLTIKISPFDNRDPTYYYFNHIDHINIEGFEQENSPCLVILPPPLLNSGFAFQGIKPFVYIIADPDEKIFEKCEMNKKESLLSRRIHSKSYGGEEYRKKKKEKSHQEEIPIEDEEYSIEGKTNSKKMNLSERSPEKKDTLFQLSSSSSEEDDKKNLNIKNTSDNVDNKDSNITASNTAKNQNLNVLTKKDNVQIIPFTEKPNSRNKSTTQSIPICIQKENPLMNKTTCGNIHYSSNANMTIYTTHKTQSKESKEVNRISQILFNICHHTTLNTPPSSSSSSLSKPKKDKSKLPPNSKRTATNGINSSLVTTKSRNSQAVLARTKTHQQSSSLNRGTNPLMNNNLSFFEKEGSNYDYICKTIDQQANGVSVKPVIIKESVSKENRSEKPRKKKSMHIISNNPLKYRVKRHNGECCLRNNINNKNKDKNNISSNNNNSSVKFNSNNIDNCLNNKALVKGVINRKIVRAKKTCFTNDLLSCYNSSTISNHSELNGNGTVRQKKKSDI